MEISWEEVDLEGNRERNGKEDKQNTSYARIKSLKHGIILKIIILHIKLSSSPKSGTQ